MSTGMVSQPAEASEDAATAFTLIGGEERIRALVDRFYDLMDLDADLAALRATHGPSLENARERLFLFLCGWMGGPDYYVERFGHPRLRMRHMPFAIGTLERDQWLVCIGRAMQETGVDEALAERLMVSFFKTADWMRNQPR